MKRRACQGFAAVHCDGTRHYDADRQSPFQTDGGSLRRGTPRSATGTDPLATNVPPCVRKKCEDASQADLPPTKKTCTFASTYCSVHTLGGESYTARTRFSRTVTMSDTYFCSPLANAFHPFASSAAAGYS